MIKNIYCVTMQVFGKDGTVLTNEYQKLVTPFHPEEAKLMYMREHPGVVLERDNIKILSHLVIEDEIRHQKIMNFKEDILRERELVRQDAGRGMYGDGDAAVTKVKKAMVNILERELTEGLPGGNATEVRLMPKENEGKDE